MSYLETNKEVNQVIQVNRLWKGNWNNLAPSQKLEALKDTLMEIVDYLQKEPSLQLKDVLESKVSHEELRAMREADDGDFRERVDEAKEEILEKVNAVIDGILDLKDFNFAFYSGSEVEQTQKALKDLKDHVNNSFVKLQKKVRGV